MFLHVAEGVSQKGWRKYARNYEIFSLSMVIYLVLMDIICSVPGFLPEERRTVDIGGVILLNVDWAGLVEKIEQYIYYVFTLEYTLRFWACPEDDAYAGIGSCRARLRWMRGGMEMVDFVVLSGYYAGNLSDSDDFQGLGALRMLRLLRIAALFKMERKTNSFSKIVSVMSSKRNELTATLFMATVLAVMSATMMYTFEGDVNPWFKSVPAALWWSIAALTTVGYGDVYPVTVPGKLVAIFTAFFGIGLFALPAGILGSGFADALNEEESAEEAACLADVEKEKEMVNNLIKDVDRLKADAERVMRCQRTTLKLLRGLTPEEVKAARERMMCFPGNGFGAGGGGVGRQGARC
mmetsp:Transcript_18835/g.31311  ORF Transcript_18835/g.31311 Transcript_18835/m.31311 type:complete len:352 (-) Transcript_18835:112-1167(-)